MVTFLEIASGPQEGSRYRVDDGIQLGRSKGHIIINDPKASSLHAQIETDGKGQFVMVDLNSSNGLIINGRRVKRVALLPGVTFEIGRTKIHVVQVGEIEAEGYGRIVTWRTILRDNLEKHKGQNELKPQSGQVFIPALKMTFLQGIQTDEVLTLGYGPRSFGASSLDVELLDPEAPGLAFEIHPQPGGAMLKNLSGVAVTLNNQAVKTETLSEGDVITVGNSVIRIGYI
jgi:pSer/pThr/pTyr-binding forkhead associated (FHA) protein